MKLSLIPIALTLIALAKPAEAAEIFNQNIDAETQGIIISGEIERGDDEKFRKLTIEFPNAWVALDSPGGALIPALEIGRLIRLRGYTTVVLNNNTCASSCALIWLAGGERIIAGVGKIGFHAGYVDEAGRKVESGIANALIGHYLSQLGLPQRAAVFATSASPNDIVWLTTSNKADAGIDFTALPWEGNETKVRPQAEAQPRINAAVAPSLRIQSTERPATQPSNPMAGRSTADKLRLRFRAPGAAEIGARTIGATGDLEKPLADHLRLIYLNDAVIERVAEEIDAAKIDIDKNPEAVGALILRFSTSAIWKGMRRLPQRDVNSYISYMAYIVLSDDSSCSMTTDSGRVNIREFQTIARRGDDYLRAYLSLIRKALFAEAEGSPSVITLDTKQTEIAENAWGEVLVEALEKRGSAEAKRLGAIMLNFDAATPQDKCEANKLMFPEIARMPGIAGDWFRRVFLTYVVDSF